MYGEAIWTSGKRLAAVFNSLQTMSGEERDTELSNGHSLRSFHLTIRAVGGELTGEVKCLAKSVAISPLQARDLIFLVDLSLDSCMHAIRMFFKLRREDNYMFP